MDDKLSLAAVAQSRLNSLSYTATYGAMSQTTKPKVGELELAKTIATIQVVII